ncbi:MAG: ABC transporter ATP-binding protein [Deltaproteobacteria bacterium]|nr:ABC transporter ATP-binding protein [Deltaproteobacteria bacterium]MBI2349613.1 ABC transporter ATP-binding protein [Deltaproteobacteria bacterium]
MVKIESLEKYFGEDKERVHVLKGVTLEIPEGSLYTFLGPSGCGKTTTLRCVAGLERPEGGKISIDGKAVFASGERVYVPTNKRPIGMVFQSYAIWPHMTVFENVAYPLTIQRRPKSEIRQKVEDVLKIVGLHGLEDRPAPKLSGGQQQRVAFARALVNEPKVMLLDEPLSNLDAKLRVQMRFEIKALQRRVNITTIFVTHDQSEALAISDQIAVMHAGRLIEVGTPHQLYSRPKRKFTATFLGLTNLIEGKVLDLGADSRPGKIETAKGVLSFIPAAGLVKGQPAVLSIRPEHIQVHKQQPQGLENVVEGTIKEAVFMGDAYHCQIAVGDMLLAVHTHPFLSMNPGEKVYLHLDPQSCNGLPAEDVEGMDESMLGV